METNTDKTTFGMPTLTKEEINKADFFSVPEEYAD